MTAALFFCLSTPLPALADSPDVPDAFRIPAIQAAQVLMQAGRWSEAREILESLKPRDEGEETERLFLLGVAEARLGMLRSAAQRFEAILARRPGLTRVRLELAQVYSALGRDGKARFHFKATLADPLPASVKDAVTSYLNRIDARKRWSASLSFSVLPESNPAKQPAGSVINIGGIPFQLSDDSRAASGTGLLVNTGTQYSPVVGENLRGVLAGSVAGKFYRNDKWNDVSLQGDFGITRLFDRGDAGAACAWAKDGSAVNATASRSAPGPAAACDCRRKPNWTCLSVPRNWNIRPGRTWMAGPCV